MGDPTPDIQEWVAAAARQLGLDIAEADQDALVTAVLDLTADVAHGVNRPAAPVTAFLVGLAAGPGRRSGGRRARPHRGRA